MRFKYAWAGVLAGLLSTSLVACGTVPDDQKQHGGILRVTTLDLDTRDIDAISACPADAEEDFHEVVAARGTANLDNAAFAEMENPPGVKVEGYTVEYEPMNGGPALDGFDFEDGIFVPGGGSASMDVAILPIQGKLQFEDRVSGSGPFQYTVRFEFLGRNDFGTRVRARHSTTVQLGDFDDSGC